MKIVDSIELLRGELVGNSDIGFVPTMGALHEGHLELVRRAKRECSVVVVSIFVNPTQFNDRGDLERYPRTLECDALMLEGVGADFIFAPSVDELYPQGEIYSIVDPRLLPLIAVMEGAHRPGHFDGVVQVVSRLLDIVEPQRAYFGFKDYQQLAIISKMVSVEGRSVDIVPCDIVRAEDGLALSSRNALLSIEQRAVAPTIYRVIAALREAIDSPGSDCGALVDRAILEINKNEYLCVQYVKVVDADTLQEPIAGARVRICVAVMCGDVRLIDNI